MSDFDISSGTSNWMLVDGYYTPLDWDGSERILIESEAHLKKLLEQFRNMDPRMVNLISPNETMMAIGIGGELGGIHYYFGTGKGGVTARPRTRCTSHILGFRSEGEICEFFAHELMPRDQVIEIARFFYKHGSVPESVEWVRGRGSG